VQAKALETLSKFVDKKYEPLFNKYVNDSSYSVAGSALEGLIKLQPEQAYDLANKYRNDARGKLSRVVATVIMKNHPTEDDFNMIFENYMSPITSEDEALAKFQGTFTFADYLSKLKDDKNVKKGV